MLMKCSGHYFLIPAEGGLAAAIYETSVLCPGLFQTHDNAAAAVAPDRQNTPLQAQMEH